jgi:hypothetical protein
MLRLVSVISTIRVNCSFEGGESCDATCSRRLGGDAQSIEARYAIYPDNGALAYK